MPFRHDYGGVLARSVRGHDSCAGFATDSCGLLLTSRRRRPVSKPGRRSNQRLKLTDPVLWHVPGGDNVGEMGAASTIRDNGRPGAPTGGP